jgi:Na+/H+ antiporter NhaC
MTTFAIFLAVLISACIIFFAVFVPSETNAQDRYADNLDLRGQWKTYLATFLATVMLLALLRLWLKGRVYAEFSDMFIFYTPLLAVSPGARRAYRGMRDFFLRRGH